MHKKYRVFYFVILHIPDSVIRTGSNTSISGHFSDNAMALDLCQPVTRAGNPLSFWLSLCSSDSMPAPVRIHCTILCDRINISFIFFPHQSVILLNLTMPSWHRRAQRCRLAACPHAAHHTRVSICFQYLQSRSPFLHYNRSCWIPISSEYETPTSVIHPSRHKGDAGLPQSARIFC